MIKKMNKCLILTLFSAQRAHGFNFLHTTSSMKSIHHHKHFIETTGFISHKTHTALNAPNTRLYQSLVEEKTSVISDADNIYMRKAIEAASNGLGNTFPNPAVGCVLVSGDDEIIGVGFHPKAGYPHAEVFALFEACGYVDSGVDAAKSVVKFTKNSINERDEVMETVDDLLQTYSSENGAQTLFENRLTEKDVTAYVTLEPCCHFGKTPPCAYTFVQAGVKRVVVGFRDPNPKVDGGGFKVLEDSGIPVDLMIANERKASSKAEAKNAQDCANIVSSFVKRIAPRTESEGADILDYDSYMNGAKRSILRSAAGRRKNDNSMVEFAWPSSGAFVDAKDANVDLEEAVANMNIDHSWMEAVDNALWSHELILLRLTNAVQKKKGAKILGERIAKELNAHVAQVVGHTALLYRPARPPLLSLEPVEEDIES